MRPLFSCAVVLALALATSATSASAMVVPINHAERLSLSGAAASVIVGNTQIVTVTVVDTHTVYVMGKGAGTTNVTILDRTGRPIFASEMTVAAVGSNVTLYRGDKRVTVNCAYGCTEADGAATPLASTGAGPVAATAAAPTKLMP